MRVNIRVANPCNKHRVTPHRVVAKHCCWSTKELRMSPLTVFLGKLVGLYCIVAASALMAHKQATVESLRALIRNPPLLLFVEVIALIAGLAMVLGHNVWSGGVLPVIVTLVGWLVTIRGAVLLALPQDAKLKLLEALRYEERFFVYMGATLVLGIYLTFAAFSA
jgi:hypothetical protein